jgi:hypothetical protein
VPVRKSQISKFLMFNPQIANSTKCCTTLPKNSLKSCVWNDFLVKF